MNSLPSNTLTSNILIIGAGGIGCELLKSLLASQFKKITIIDLDTIDVSNLNRQFLFRRQHVGKSKSMIAKESGLEFIAEEERKDYTIVAYHDNIKNPKFNIEFFKKFDIVLNALDNLEARKHVNRFCLSANVPLVESGTQGYLGQVTVISKDYECFECQPKGVQKTYATCTIRNTPDLPVHCIVWAKHILAALFGAQDDSNPLSDYKLLQNDNIPENFDSDIYTATKVYNMLYTVEIEKQLEKTERWLIRPPPKVLHLCKLAPVYAAYSCTHEECSKDIVKQVIRNSPAQFALGSVEEWTYEFIYCFVKILKERKSDIGQIEFDKDDALLMEFVVALSNLRMHCYGIPTLSRFDVKGIAGNIIHAISTTNAIAAGLIVLQAIKVLDGKIANCKTGWISQTGPYLIQPIGLSSPNKDCVVCSRSQKYLKIDTNKPFQNLYKILSSHLSLLNPSIDADLNGKLSNLGCVEDLEEMDLGHYLNLPMNSSSIKIDEGAILFVKDDSFMNLQIFIKHHPQVEGQPEYEFSSEPFVDKIPTSEESALGKHKADDDLEEIDINKKRKSN